MGFHSFWVPENHFRRSGSFPAPLLPLAAAAARTSTIKLGCISYLLPIRNAMLAAEEVAVLDRLSNGRLILGLGRGIQDDVFDAFDIDSAEKRELFAKRLDTMRKAWAGEPLAETRDGKPVVLNPLPVQQPSPPLWVAAIGPKALQQVAGLGLPYLASPMDSLEKLRLNYGKYHELIAELQLPPVATVPIMRTAFISGDKRRCVDLLKALGEQIPRPLREKAGAVENWAIVGPRDFVHDTLCRYQETINVSHLILRAGLPGVSVDEQLQSHGEILALKFPL